MARNELPFKLEDHLKQFEGFFQYRPTWATRQLMSMNHTVIALFTGNQCMKTSSVAYQYVLRILGWHPVAVKNILYFECRARAKAKDEQKQAETADAGEAAIKAYLQDHRTLDSATWSVLDYPKNMRCPECGGPVIIHERKNRIIRFASEVLPMDKGTTGLNGSGQSSEIKNSTYPEFKKWLPRCLLKEDLTARRPSIRIADIHAGREFGKIKYRAQDIIIEFVSYSQQVQAGAGVQRVSVWCDEESPQDFWDEQLPRIVAEEGDIILTLTPANRMSWTYDEIFEQAALYVRTPAICEFLSKDGNHVANIERTEKRTDIAVIQAATDDNPTLSREQINARFMFEDPETMATRRYGVHRQSTGRIFGAFHYGTHFIKKDEYFPGGIPGHWTHARAEDYHEANNHAILWCAISPEDECFVYMEWFPSPKRYTTQVICEGIAERSGHAQDFRLNLIDPLAAKLQPTTNTSVIEDMTRIFWKMRRDGICAGGMWEAWKTHGTRGREEIRMRLENAKKAGKPFNNSCQGRQGGGRDRMPTLWILNCCPETAKSLSKWRLEQWAGHQTSDKEAKEKPAQRFSHACTALEALFKDPRFRPPTKKQDYDRGSLHNVSYFRPRRVA